MGKVPKRGVTKAPTAKAPQSMAARSRGAGVSAAATRSTSSSPKPIAATIEKWYRSAARPLPWRLSPRDPYLSLVSEFMLQQTQVARVLEKFDPFISRFPTIHTLAAATEQQVLAMWSGLGYYRRARLLHAAARAIVAHHVGFVPRDTAVLRTLPGIGRYTAGAIASIVFDRPEPIVDGNVSRVLLRLHGHDAATNDPAAVAWTWDRAAELARAAASPATVNEGLMELGAVVCTPRSPRCSACPLSRPCIARREGRQDEIPRPKAALKRPPMSVESVVVRDRRGRVLLQKREESGMWASMWQAPTIEHDGPPARAPDAHRRLDAWLNLAGLRHVGAFMHPTSHRDVRVRVWHAQTVSNPTTIVRQVPSLTWRTADAAAKLGMSNLQRRVFATVP